MAELDITIKIPDWVDKEQARRHILAGLNEVLRPKSDVERLKASIAKMQIEMKPLNMVLEEAFLGQPHTIETVAEFLEHLGFRKMAAVLREITANDGQGTD